MNGVLDQKNADFPSPTTRRRRRAAWGVLRAQSTVEGGAPTGVGGWDREAVIRVVARRISVQTLPV